MDANETPVVIDMGKNKAPPKIAVPEAIAARDKWWIARVEAELYPMDESGKCIGFTCESWQQIKKEATDER